MNLIALQFGMFFGSRQATALPAVSTVLASSKACSVVWPNKNANLNHIVISVIGIIPQNYMVARLTFGWRILGLGSTHANRFGNVRFHDGCIRLGHGADGSP